jgi:hypothetical protein
MKNEVQVEIVDVDQWSEAARPFLDRGHQQVPAYASALAGRQGGRIEAAVIRADSDVIGAALIRRHGVPIMGGGIAYIAGGPLTRRGREDDLETLGQTLRALRAHYSARHGMTLRILGPTGSPKWNAAANMTFGAAGFRYARCARSYRTLIVSIDGEEDALLSSFSKYWRRNVRRAWKQNAEIVTGVDDALFAELEPLDDALASRKTYRRVLDLRFYRELQHRLPPEDRLHAIVQRIDGVAQAGLVVSFLGDTAVPLSLVTTVDGLRRYGAYAVTWRSIEMARDAGQRFYDVGGIDPIANPGGYDFKRGMRGVDLSAPGPFEHAAAGMSGTVVRNIERTVQRLRRAA